MLHFMQPQAKLKFKKRKENQYIGSLFVFLFGLEHSLGRGIFFKVFSISFVLLMRIKRSYYYLYSMI